MATFDIASRDFGRIAVVGAIVGAFGIHHTVLCNGVVWKYGATWSCTHLPTGHSINHWFVKRADAVKCARMLSQPVWALTCWPFAADVKSLRQLKFYQKARRFAKAALSTFSPEDFAE